MNRKLPLQLCILPTLVFLFMGTSLAQSLGDLARNNKASKKSARVITNETLPEASGPANGAAIIKASAKQPLPTEADMTRGSAKNSLAIEDPSKDAQREKQLRAEISTVTKKIAEYDSKLDAETNEATRAGMQNMIDDYEKLRQSSQQQLDELIAAKSKGKTAK
jgi:hypothetical protein